MQAFHTVGEGGEGSRCSRASAAVAAAAIIVDYAVNTRLSGGVLVSAYALQGRGRGVEPLLLLPPW